MSGLCLMVRPSVLTSIERESRTDDWAKIKQVLPENWIDA